MSENIPGDVVDVLRNASNVVVSTGAGTSAESGVPTFREAQTGLWAQYDPEQLATPSAFKRNPQVVWDWYAWRRKLVSKAEPNPGHKALAAMERQIPGFTLITQNVDGLHQRAGSSNVLELHGSLQRSKCFDRGHHVSSWTERVGQVPVCPQCESLLRPDVVWFGENLPADALETAFDRSASCDVFISVGTAALVQPAASLPLEAIDAGAFTIEINPDVTPLTPLVRHTLKGPSGTILPALLAAAFPKR